MAMSGGIDSVSAVLLRSGYPEVVGHYHEDLGLRQLRKFKEGNQLLLTQFHQRRAPSRSSMEFPALYPRHRKNSGRHVIDNFVDGVSGQNSESCVRCNTH